MSTTTIDPARTGDPAPQGVPPSTASLRERFRPLFDAVAAGAARREQDRVLPFDEVAALKEAGFGALRVPVEYGGSGASLRQLFTLLTDLAVADSNLTQLWRGHFAYVEGTLLQPPSAHRDRWLFDIAAGTMIGNASSELTGISLRDIRTTLTSPSAQDGALTLTGSKYYSTGSLYADWIAGSAVRDGERVGYAVRATAPGVERIDDWDGFGQRLTGSGTTHFTEVRVDPRNVRPFSPDAPSHVPAFFQLVLVASLAGIARAAAQDAAAFVRPRTRSYVNAPTPLPREDPQVLQVVGELTGRAFAADAVVLAAADLLDSAYEALHADRPAPGREEDGTPAPSAARPAVDAADIAVSQAQLVAVDQALTAATQLFEVGGASATSTGRALDRHWRNARTISSHNPAIYKARSVGHWAVHGEREPQPGQA
ncbi:acyl-CoA dehydrogenase family protein [Arthrobacter agilis]|uniref:acyl-CoA dehydrogenase family protein n=1 Tax=Arthrobacter agilis TaxID=37921 RepID=UPI00277E8811|nr:acyl-CoA dehydrogenase family protein [Arthrobacter agilis]MDQ0734889.1 alkylation response protein AidB-like acyl-CoA dehydrogenase [Arthrobacter agilis]